jgi:hypothetical protein
VIRQAPSIFESFNARALKPSQVASTFVPSAHFTKLAKRGNSLLVGPRGSGKTTLLKMLQPQALESWGHEVADHYRSTIDYTGVFIATDLTWGAQVDALGGGKLDPESHRLLAGAAFTTHILRSLVIAKLSRLRRDIDRSLVPFRRVELSDKGEADLVRLLSDGWRLKPAIPSLLSVKHALSRRLSLIKEIANKESTLGERGRAERLSANDFLFLDFLEASALATEQFDDIVGESDSRWAFMFDELEIAPQWIRDDLIRMLRSTEPRFLFKLALNPFGQNVLPLEDALSPAPDHDYEQIQLWYVERYEGYSFCENLWYSMLQERNIPRQKPSTALGVSIFETASSEWAKSGTAYDPTSRLGRLFDRLVVTDKSFAEYLRKKEINPKTMHLLEPARRAADLRKVAPILPIREFYRVPDAPISARVRSARSRKKAAPYNGAEAVFAISEGNPRWFIAIVGRMLDRWPNFNKKVPESVQMDEIEKGAERFSAMLRTIAVSPENVRLNSGGLLTVLDRIGQYFHAQLVGKEFIPEPVSTFVVDASIQESLVAALGQALNAGAIVFVPEDPSQILLRTLRGERFRISYLLAPHYGLALRLGRKINLSTVLADSGGGKNLELPMDRG